MGRRQRYIVALVATLLLVASACADGDGGGEAEGPLQGTSITFSVSLAEEERATVQGLLSDFSEETGASVELASVTSADLPQKLEVEVGTGNPTIHLFAQDNLALRVLVDSELVQDVSDVEVPDAVLEAMIPDTFDATTYFLPFRPNVKVVYANDERFGAAGAEPPTTHDEFRAAAEALAEEGGGGKVTLSFAEGDPAAVTLSEWIVSFGGDPLVLNDAGSVAAYEFLQEMWADGLFARESLQAKFDTQVDYLTGEIGWLAQNWPFTTANLDEQGLLDRFTVYEGWSGPERAAHVVGGDVLGIPEGVEGEQRAAAVALAEFLMSQGAQETLAAENAWPSIRDDAYAEVPEAQQSTFDAIQAALEDGWYRPNVPYWSDASDAMNEAIRRVIVDGDDAQTVLDELHEDIAEAAERAGEEYPPADEA